MVPACGPFRQMGTVPFFPPLAAPASTRPQAALETALEPARRRWFALAAMSLHLRGRAAEAMLALQARGLPAALIKGEDFADRLYARPGLRPFRDVDLLLPREAMGEASAVVRQLGYREVQSGAKYEEGYGERTFDSFAAPRVRLELHWNLINSPSQRRRSSLGFDDLQWEASPPGGQRRLRASPASSLLVAAVHAVLGHRFDRLQHLCDIRQICRGAAGAPDLKWLREAAGRTGTRAPLAAALEVTARLLGDSASRRALGRLRLGRAAAPCRWLVTGPTLLRPYTPWNKFRRTLVREWMKRAG